MRRLCLLVLGVLALLASAAAQPALDDGGVLNAASYKVGIAPGAIFVAFGRGMGPAGLVQATSLPLKTDLSGTSISFTPSGGGTAIQALMVYTLAGQIAALLPSSAAPGRYDVKVTYNGQTSAARSVDVVGPQLRICDSSRVGRRPRPGDLRRSQPQPLHYRHVVLQWQQLGPAPGQAG